jgi:hypothetical protein
VSPKASAQVLIELSATTAKLSTDFAKAKSEFSKFAGEMQHIAHLVEASFAFKIGEGLLEGLHKLTEGVIDLAREGEKAKNLERAFESLGGSVGVLKKAEEATLGVVSAADLMQEANKGLVAGVPQFAQSFDKVAELGTRVAEALGTDAKTGIDEVTEAIIKGRAPALRHVGILIDTEAAAKKFAVAHGIAASESGSFEKALTKTQKQLANSAAAMDQLNAAILRYPPAVDSVTKAHTAANNAWAELLEHVGMQMNENTSLIASFRDLESTIKGIDIGEFGNNIAKLSAVFVDLANVGIKASIGAVNQLFDDMKRLHLFMEESWRGSANPIAAADKRFDIEKEDAQLRSATKSANEFAIAVNSAFNKFREGSKPTTAEVSKLLEEAKGVGEAMQKAGGVDKIGLREGLANTAQQLQTLRENAVAVTAAVGQGSDQAAAKVAKLNEELARLNSGDAAAVIKQNFDSALKEGNFASAQDFLNKYKTAISAAADEEATKFKSASQEAVDEHKRYFIEKAVGPMAEAMKEQMGAAVAKHFSDAMKVGNLGAAKDFLVEYQSMLPTLGEKGKEQFALMGEELKKKIQEAMDTLLSSAGAFLGSIGQITGGLKQAFGIDMPEGMRKVLDEAQGILSIFEGVVKLFEAMEAISKAIAAYSSATNFNAGSSGGGGGLFGGGLLSSLFGGGGGGAGEAIGQNADGSLIYAAGGDSAGIGVGDMLGYAGAGYGLYSHLKGKSGWGEKGGAVAGTAIGAYFGGPIGAAIGANLGGMAGGELD